MSTPQPQDSLLYTADEVLERIHDVLGITVRPPELRRERHRQGAQPNSRVRATAGLPPPVRHGRAPRWDAAAIERWLVDHPRIQVERVKEELRKGAARTVGGQRRKLVVLKAQDEGLSWAQIAEVISEVDGQPVSRQVAQRRRRVTSRARMLPL